MARRESYSDTFTGEADKGIRAILDGDEGEDNALRLRKILLKVINNELTPRQKQIIMLYYFKKKDTVRIGEELRITPQAVSAAMARARLRLYRILQYYI
ncbi:MAG: sigma factor-like helix-turn-helix DNA-binding protein [Ruminococcus sp.]|nr:sigma factor-like helix-turn-helix DNA-binding protein [Ruminococcus sp.]